MTATQQNESASHNHGTGETLRAGGGKGSEQSKDTEQGRDAAQAHGTVQSTASHRVIKVLFHVVAITEAITWVGLLWGMYMRYISASSVDPVPFWGMAHGAVFMAYCAVAVIAAWRFRWRFWELLVALVMAIPPLATVVLEVWYARTGRLDAGRMKSKRLRDHR